MDAQLELVLVIAGAGVALAALKTSRMSGVRHEIADVRNEIRNLGERLTRVEVAHDVIRAGMQLLRPSAEPESEDQAA